MYFAAPEQINFQVPWELAGRNEVSFSVKADGLVSSLVSVPLATYAPGIFTTSAEGQGAVLNEQARLVNSDAPARAGEILQVYATGLGPVTNTPLSGVPALANPLSTTLETPIVTVGGIQARVLFSGLAPSFVGLYQVNIEVPVGVSAGDSVPLVITIGGVSSNTVTIAVR